MGNPIYKRKNYIIVQNRNYFTVVNLINKTHTHLKTYKQSKLIIHWAIKGRIPNRYNNYMRNSIKRVM